MQDPRNPSWAPLNIGINEVEDETEFLQYGQYSMKDFFTTYRGMISQSAEGDNLLEKPEGRYKFASFEIFAHQTSFYI